MSKVQTFEEWWLKEGCLYMEDYAKPDAKMAWQSAMENAARVCEDAASDWRHSGDDFSDAEYLSGAIRDAAKR